GPTVGRVHGRGRTLLSPRARANRSRDGNSRLDGAPDTTAPLLRTNTSACHECDRGASQHCRSTHNGSLAPVAALGWRVPWSDPVPGALDRGPVGLRPRPRTLPSTGWVPA